MMRKVLIVGASICFAIGLIMILILVGYGQLRSGFKMPFWHSRACDFRAFHAIFMGETNLETTLLCRNLFQAGASVVG